MQNTELLLILAGLLVAAVLLSAVLMLTLYLGRESKQKGTYVTGEGMADDEAEEEGEQKKGKRMPAISKSTSLISNGGPGGGRRLLDLGE